MAQKLKNLPAMQETQVRSMDWEDPLGKEMATHSSILSWKILWTEEPGWLQFMGMQRVGHNWQTNTLLFKKLVVKTNIIMVLFLVITIVVWCLVIQLCPTLPNPGSEPGSLSLWVDSFPSEPPGKPKNIGVGNLYLLQGVFPTHESKWCILHYRWALYQLNYQGSPRIC